MSDDTFQHRRYRMVEHQIEARGVTDTRILAAIRAVPRECFVPESLAEFAYEDAPLPIEEGQTISQPFIVALMVSALQVRPNERVLEVGAGSGYAAAVLSKLASEVHAVERHAKLAQLAQERMVELGYQNVHVHCADGTKGLTEYAPYDAILVSAGGPQTPPSLLGQLAIGGRLVIPVGTNPRTQELLCITKTAEHSFDEELLGRVQFVPLVGAEGWALDARVVPAGRARRPLRMDRPNRRRLASLVAESCEPFENTTTVSLDGLLNRIGSARVVLIGEATHGTSEFYEMRDKITRELIWSRGFNIVALEADWPDARAIDRYVRSHGKPFLRTPAFSRFPAWMWRNQETRRFVDWLADINDQRPAEQAVSVHGLDLYSLNNSIGAVLDYLERVDPDAAEAARVRYGCFSPWEMDPATYGRAAVGGGLRSCEPGVIETLSELLRHQIEYLKRDGEEFFDAERNAVVIREAERYYRTMYYGSRDSWNLRDRHMFDTLLSVMRHRGENSRAVVWAHNSHVGNAAATEMSVRGELNLGQLARERFGPDAYAIGFGTHQGTVAAASNWDEPMQVMQIRPSHKDSYERIFHESGTPSFMLHLRRESVTGVRREFMRPHLERAIGVIYRPDTEILSHYFQAVLPAQFDEFIWFDQTTAVSPLEIHEIAGMPETYPFGL